MTPKCQLYILIAFLMSIWACQKDLVAPLDFEEFTDDESYVVLNDSVVVLPDASMREMVVVDTFLQFPREVIIEQEIKVGSKLLGVHQDVRFYVDVKMMQETMGMVQLTVCDASIMSLFTKSDLKLAYDMELAGSRGDCDFEDVEELTDDCEINTCVKINSFGTPRVELIADFPIYGIKAGFDIALDGNIHLTCNSLTVGERRKFQLASKKRLIKVLKKVKKFKVFQKKFPKGQETADKVLNFLDDLPDIALGVFVEDFNWEGTIDIDLPLRGKLNYELVHVLPSPVPIPLATFDPEADFDPQFELDCAGFGKLGLYLEMVIKFPSILDLFKKQSEKEKKKVTILEMEGRMFSDIVASPRRDFASGLRLTFDGGVGARNMFFLRNLLGDDIVSGLEALGITVEDAGFDDNFTDLIRLGTYNLDIDCGQIEVFDHFINNHDGNYNYFFNVTTTEREEGQFNLFVDNVRRGRFNYFEEHSIITNGRPRNLRLVDTDRIKCVYVKDIDVDCIFVDPRDQEEYCIVTIGGKDWFSENLRFTDNEKKGVWLDHNTARKAFGRFYTYQEIRSGDLCPPGFHVPSRNEWDALINSLGGNTIAGSRMKSGSGWQSNSSPSRFNARPNGYYTKWDNKFSRMGREANFWTSTMPSGLLYSAYSVQIRDQASMVRFLYDVKDFGHACRCVRDN